MSTFISNSDLFQMGGHIYLLILYIFSKYPVLQYLPKTVQAEHSYSSLRNHFLCLECPINYIYIYIYIQYTDDGPQFSYPEFIKFAIDWEFQHITSRLHYPQPNGVIERYVQCALYTQSSRYSRRANIYIKPFSA